MSGGGEFGWQATKDGRVRISWRGRVVTTLGGAPAARFLRQAEGADDETVQGLLARATSNFKRGNERRA
ncbi:MAG TPA: hypothetical protein VFN93_08635 [Gaiellaceae bacterium]|nr:hypothetical protein [Gaiellaceae bacterium]